MVIPAFDISCEVVCISGALLFSTFVNCPCCDETVASGYRGEGVICRWGGLPYPTYAGWHAHGVGSNMQPESGGMGEGVGGRVLDALMGR